MLALREEGEDRGWDREERPVRERAPDPDASDCAKQVGVDIEPPPLWGTYESEEYVTAWGRELGVSACRVMRLQPEIVAIAAVEPAKLRAAAKHVQKGGMGAVALH